MIDLPIEGRENPHAVAAREHLDQWVREQGLVSRPAAARRFAQADFSQFAALTYPTVSDEGLFLIADWFAWLFLLDDQFDDGLVGRDPRRVEALMADILAILQAPRPDLGALLQAPPIVTAFAELWYRTAPSTTQAWRQRFTDHVVAGGVAAFWEADNRRHGRVPEVPAYVEHRRHTGAIYVCMDLIEAVHGVDLPQAVYQDDAFQAALQAACDVVCWTNDLYSLDKERSLGEYHNLVSIVEHNLALDRAEATRRVVAETNARIGHYFARQPEVLTRFPARHRELAVMLDGMRSWMRGNLDWSASTPRYAAASHPGPSADDYLEPVTEAAVSQAPVSGGTW